MTIAIDEAAHYNFFLEGARLYLYYYLEETLQALVDVLRSFTMPAADLIINYDDFIKILCEAEVFSGIKYSRQVVRVALEKLGITAIRQVERGLKQTRAVPDSNGHLRDTAIFEGVNFSIVESAVMRLFTRIQRYEDEVGLSKVQSTQFVANQW